MTNPGLMVALVFALLAAGDGTCRAGPFDLRFVTGIHAHHLESLPEAASAGAEALRLWDSGTAWRNLQPSPGVFDFRRLDEWMDSAEKNRLPVVLTLGCTPEWAAARKDELSVYGPGCASEPQDMSAWRSYVRTVAHRYRARIECYEVWNEASFPTDQAFAAGAGGDGGEFFTGTVADLVELTRAASEEIRREDPNACVLTPSFHTSGDIVAKLDRFLSAGGGPYADAVSFHFYFVHQPEESVAVMRLVRQVLQRHGLTSRPIWNSEVGAAFAQRGSERSDVSDGDWVCSLLLRTLLINFSEGIERVYWYAWDNSVTGFGGTKGEVGRDGYRAAASLLRGLQDVKCAEHDSLWLCHLKFQGDGLDAIWDAGREPGRFSALLPQGGSRWGAARLALAPGSRVPLDARPILVRRESEDAAEAILIEPAPRGSGT